MMKLTIEVLINEDKATLEDFEKLQAGIDSIKATCREMREGERIEGGAISIESADSNLEKIFLKLDPTT